MTANNHMAPAATLADVALIDAERAAATGAMSVSWWNAEVAAGRAPQPAVRRPRCTRWRVADVRDFWARFPESADAGRADVVMATARKASAVAQRQRAAKQAEGA